jgi:hypothetical protein
MLSSTWRSGRRCSPLALVRHGHAYEAHKGSTVLASDDWLFILQATLVHTLHLVLHMFSDRSTSYSLVFLFTLRAAVSVGCCVTPACIPSPRVSGWFSSHAALQLCMAASCISSRILRSRQLIIQPRSYHNMRPNFCKRLKLPYLNRHLTCDI